MGHTTPEEAAQAFIDLNVRVLLGIHWEEPLDEPPRRVLAEIQRRGIESERAWIIKLGKTRPW